jgi:TolB protein
MTTNSMRQLALHRYPDGLCRKKPRMEVAVFVVVMTALVHLSGCGDDKSAKSTPDGPGRNDRAYRLHLNLSGSLQNPAFSPDGESVVFTRFTNGYNQEPADLYTYNLQTEKLAMLVSDGSGNVNSPGSTWNGPVRSIVFSSSRDAHDEIFLIAENGSNGDETQITDRMDRVAYEPSISPDGQWVVFESHPLDVEDNGIITKYRIDGSSPYRQLTSSGEDCRQPDWSPSGDKILYQKLDAGQWDIWIMEPDGTNQSRVTSGEGDKTDASFTKDGLYIVFSADFESEYASIYKISRKGGMVQRLTAYEGYDGAPSLSPDQTKLVFESYGGDPDDSAGTTIWLLESLP